MSDAERKRKQRADERDLKIPPVKEPQRRRDCLADVYLFLSTYFGDIFYQPFTSDRREMIDAIMHAARYGGDQAVAGPRADGKTRSALFGTLQLALSGHIAFPIIISKSGPRAKRELKNLKQGMAESAAFCEDFPEVAEPIRALGGWSSRARQQTAFGTPTQMEWADELIIFPTIPTEVLHANGWNKEFESAARGQIVASLGIEGPIRGYSVRNQRPDLAILDDIDDRKSARSELQTETRENIVEQDVGGLAGPDKTIARVMLCTLINRTCVAATFTDRSKKQSWRGQRHKLLEKKPDREDLWDTYMVLRQGRKPDDPDARAAHRHYLAHQAEMDAGAVLTNPYRFDSRLLDDGQPAQISALQHCYDIIADRGWDHFATEYQNDPPEDEKLKTQLVLTAYHIQHNCPSGIERRIVPEGTVTIGVAGDVQKLGLHYVAIAFNEQAAGAIIDYDFFSFVGAEGRDAADCEKVILEGLFAWHAAQEEQAFLMPDGEEVLADLTLIDMGWKEESWNTQPVQTFCSQVGFTRYMPSKGVGNYRRPADSKRLLIGDQWHVAFPGNIPVVEMNSDHWKLKVHEGFLAAPGQPGSLTLFEPPRVDGRRARNFHLSFAKHLLAETWETRFKPGFKTARSGWWKSPKPNHYFDACYAAIVTRAMRGVSVLPPTSAVAAAGPRQAAPVADPAPVSSISFRARW